MSGFDLFSVSGLGSIAAQIGCASRVKEEMQKIGAILELERRYNEANLATKYLKEFQTAEKGREAEFFRTATSEAGRVIAEFYSERRSRLASVMGVAAKGREALPFHDSISSLFGIAGNQARMIATVLAAEYAYKARSASVEAAGPMAAAALEYRSAFRALDESVRRTAGLMSANRGAIGAAFVGDHARDHLSQLLSSLSEERRFVNFAGLGITADDYSFLQDYSEFLDEAFLAATELEQTEAPEEGERLVGAFAALLDFMGKVHDSRGGKSFMLFTAVIGFLTTLWQWIPNEAPSGLPAAQAKAYEEALNGLRELTKIVERFDASDQALDEAYVSYLPRAEAKRKAMIRVSPERDSLVLYKAPIGTPLAIIRTEGRWKEVVYREPLTNRLARAWVYGSSIALLTE
jgi:hypothetical protein